jgi:hypothetical protein
MAVGTCHFSCSGSLCAIVSNSRDIVSLWMLWESHPIRQDKYYTQICRYNKLIKTQAIQLNFV